MKAGILLVLAVALGAGAAVARSAELTGYGATRAAWNAHHKEVKLSILRPGCCFGPQQNDGQFRYYNVQLNPRGRVFMYDMDFGPRISAGDARRRIQRQELPPDARLVAHKRKRECEQFQYRSARAKRAVGAASVGVEFASSASGGSYNGKVKKVTVGSLVSTKQDCGLF
jgi:hypothetical protein